MQLNLKGGFERTFFLKGSAALCSPRKQGFLQSLKRSVGQGKDGEEWRRGLFISRYNRSEARVSSLSPLHIQISTFQRRSMFLFLKKGRTWILKRFRFSATFPNGGELGRNQINVCNMWWRDVNWRKGSSGLVLWHKNPQFTAVEPGCLQFFENVCQSFTFASIAISAWLWTKGHPCFRKLGKLPQTSAPACTSQTPYNAYSFYKSTLILYVCSWA